MAVLAIVGILVLITYPSYLNHLTRARRSDGQAALIDLANRLERYYAEQNTYQTATLGSGNIATDVLTNNLSAENWYRLTIISQTAATFTLAATPRSFQAANDRTCQTLTFTNLGTKGIAAGPSGEPRGTINQCW